MKYIISWRPKFASLVISTLALGGVQVANAEELSPSAFSALAEKDIVIVGELHDNKTHHDNQAAIADFLQPKALVFEMLTRAQARSAEGVAHDDAEALDKALGWSETDWPDFALYYPIFRNAPDAQIVGAAVPRPEARKAFDNGAAAVFEGDAELYGLSQPLELVEQTRRSKLQAEAHCNALPEEILPGMIEAQRLRDARFAKATLEALREFGPPVLVITGNGHARSDWGIPRFLERAAPEVSFASIGQFVSASEEAPFDYWITTGAYTPPNGDPCTSFK